MKFSSFLLQNRERAFGGFAEIGLFFEFKKNVPIRHPRWQISFLRLFVYFCTLLVFVVYLLINAKYFEMNMNHFVLLSALGRKNFNFAFRFSSKPMVPFLLGCEIRNSV